MRILTPFIEIHNANPDPFQFLLFFSVHSIHKGLEPHLVSVHATHTQGVDPNA